MISASTAKLITTQCASHNHSEYYTKVLIILEHINDYIVTTANEGYSSIKMIDSSIELHSNIEDIKSVSSLISYRDSIVAVLFQLGYSVNIGDDNIITVSWGDYV